MIDLYQKYGLRRLINAYDKATHLCGARVSPEIAGEVSACLGEHFFLDEMQETAGRAISRATGAEWGCVTACAAAGITLGVAAAMTGRNQAKVAQLPDTAGMPHRVILQKGHAINFGAPVVQMICLSGAKVIEVGSANGCRPRHVRHELDKGGVCAIMAVESYHTSAYDGVPLADLTALARDAGVPLILDAATQELRLPELIAIGVDLLTASAHKYLGAVTAGVTAGRRDLVEAVLLHHKGIGRGMKVGKEGIIGVLAALDAEPFANVAKWAATEKKKVEKTIKLLSGLPGISAKPDPDPNGCPFLRVRLLFDSKNAHTTPHSLRQRLEKENPAIIVRAYRFDPDALYLNTSEMTDEEIRAAAKGIRSALARPA